MSLLVTLTEFAKSASDWQRLERQSQTVSVFQTYDFHQVFLRHFPQDNLHILHIQDGAQVIGIAPLVQKNEQLEFIVTQPVAGGELIADYGDIIAQQGKEQEIWQALISYAHEYNQHLVLNFLREYSPSYRSVTSFQNADFSKTIRTTDHQSLKTEITDVAPRIQLPKDWDTYLVQLPRHDRQELRRKMRKVDPSAFTVISQPTTDDVQELFRLMRFSPDKQQFLSETMGAFFTALITTFATQDRIRLFSLTHEDRPIAMILGFSYNQTVSVYNGGFDPAQSKLAPGMVLSGYALQYAIEQQYRVFDFLRGDERYKYNLGGVDQKLYTITI